MSSLFSNLSVFAYEAFGQYRSSCTDWQARTWCSERKEAYLGLNGERAIQGKGVIVSIEECPGPYKLNTVPCHDLYWHHPGEFIKTSSSGMLPYGSALAALLSKSI